MSPSDNSLPDIAKVAQKIKTEHLSNYFIIFLVDVLFLLYNVIANAWKMY